MCESGVESLNLVNYRIQFSVLKEICLVCMSVTGKSKGPIDPAMALNWSVNGTWPTAGKRNLYGLKDIRQ